MHAERRLSMAAAEALVLAGCAGVRPCTEAEALALVWRLPRVAAFAAHVRRASQGSVRLIAIAEGAPSSSSRCWEFLLAEDHADHIVLWNRVRVDPQTGLIGFWDPAADSFAP